MKPSDYEFAIGDKVITIYGDVGRVVDICKCASCVKRGFHELTWKLDGGIDGIDADWITIHDAEEGFDEYYQIGKYRFNHEFNREYVRSMISDKEAEVARLKRQLEVIEELEKLEKEDKE